VPGRWRLTYCVGLLVVLLASGCGGANQSLPKLPTTPSSPSGPLVARLKARLRSAGYASEPVTEFRVAGHVAPVTLIFGFGAETDFQTEVDFTSPHGFTLIVVVFDSAAHAASSKVAKGGCSFGSRAQRRACARASRVRVVGRVLYSARTYNGAGTINGRGFDKVVSIASA